MKKDRTEIYHFFSKITFYLELGILFRIRNRWQSGMSGRVGRVSLIFWKKSSWVGSGQVGLDQFVCCVLFRSLMEFDWIEGHLISSRVGSGRIRVGSDQFDFLKKLDQIKFRSERIRRISQIGLSSVTSTNIYRHFISIKYFKNVNFRLWLYHLGEI
jgi:hypothetical protein